MDGVQFIFAQWYSKTGNYYENKDEVHGWKKYIICSIGQGTGYKE